MPDLGAANLMLDSYSRHIRHVEGTLAEDVRNSHKEEEVCALPSPFKWPRAPREKPAFTLWGFSIYLYAIARAVKWHTITTEHLYHSTKHQQYMEGENMNQNAGTNPQTNPTASSTSSEAAQPTAGAQKNVLMGILSYIGILVIIPYLTSKHDPFVFFHIKQGLVLVVIELAVYVLGMLMWDLYPLLSIVNLAMLILSIIGIVNVIQGKEKELPLIGQFAKHFNNI
jgi:uncharacterized membrane protein